MELATTPMEARRHPFRMSDCPYDEQWQGYVLGQDATHRYLWLWMGYNIRVIAVAHDDISGYDHGWCYPRDPRTVEAAATAWDPDTQDEPAGWHKRATHPVRRAPRRAEQPDYNRPRCQHGCYIADGCRTVGCPEQPGGQA